MAFRHALSTGYPNIPADIEVIGFMPKRILNLYTQPQIIKENKIERYAEHSKGEFKNLATNNILREQFEALRETILKNICD